VRARRFSSSGRLLDSLLFGETPLRPATYVAVVVDHVCVMSGLDESVYVRHMLDANARLLAPR
jgi:hypothetical protein